MDKLLPILTETSTWRGFLSLAIAAGITISPEQQNAIIAVGLALIGLINVFRRDKKGDTINTTAPVTITTPTTITTEAKGN